MNKKLFIIITLVILAIGVGVYYYISNNNVSKVEQVKIEKNKVEKTISSSGKVVSNQQANLSFLASGRITSISKKEGDQVKKGELLASLNSESTRQSSQALKDARDALINDRELFIRKYQNEQSKAGGTTEYQLQLKRLEEQVSQAEANYQSSLSTVRNYYIYAPFDGVIYNLTKEVGETSTTGEIVMQIADLNEIYFEAEVDQEDFGSLKEGQEVRITLDAFPNDTYNGIINLIPQYVSSSNTTSYFKVNIEFSDLNSVLLGMEGDSVIIIDSSSAETNTLIFDELYKESDGSAFVWIIGDDNKLQKQKIEIGLEGDLYTEIKSDLSGKTIVMPENNKQILEEGKPAKLIGG